jgi:hypothetical protein
MKQYSLQVKSPNTQDFRWEFQLLSNARLGLSVRPIA